MEEVTLLEAIYQLHQHKKKREGIYFEIHFQDVTRKPRFGKQWSRVKKEWQYAVKKGNYEPCFAYDEKAAVSAIMSIPGLQLHFNTVPYTVHRLMPEDTRSPAKSSIGHELIQFKYECPECGYIDEMYGFCPNCGKAEMEAIY